MMVKTKQDLTGMKFGKLTVIKQGDDFIDCGRPIAGWIVSCECNPDRLFNVRQKDLKRGHTTSCGCINSERIVKQNILRKGEKRQYTKRNNTILSKENKYDLSGEFGIGYTNNGEEFWFDLEDYDLIKEYHWYIDTNGYVVANNIEGKPERMHRLVMGVTDKKSKVDHIYHTKTDNRKSQLRICSNAENIRNALISKNNTSGVTGVY